MGNSQTTKDSRKESKSEGPKEYTYTIKSKTVECIISKFVKEPDVIFNVRGTEMKVHNILLTMYSPVFNAMLNGKFNTDKNDIDCDPVIFQKFIDILYLKQVSMTFVEVLEIVNLLDYYDITIISPKGFFDKLVTNDIIIAENIYTAWSHLKVESLKESCDKAICKVLSLNFNSEQSCTIIASIESESDMLYFINKSKNKN
jgi:hypothetical protein